MLAKHNACTPKEVGGAHETPHLRFEATFNVSRLKGSVIYLIVTTSPNSDGWLVSRLQYTQTYFLSRLLQHPRK